MDLQQAGECILNKRVVYFANDDISEFIPKATMPDEKNDHLLLCPNTKYGMKLDFCFESKDEAIMFHVRQEYKRLSKMLDDNDISLFDK